MNVKKYECITNAIIIETLFLKGDILYIGNYDPAGGRPQMVFSHDKKLIGKISSDFFWDLKKNTIKEKDDTKTES